MLTAIAQAETPKPKCKDVIAACDSALEAKNKALELSDLAITECTKQKATITTEVNDLRESNSAFYRNPFIMAIFGAAAGVLTYTLVK